MATSADLNPHPLVPEVASGLLALGVRLLGSNDEPVEAASIAQAKPAKPKGRAAADSAQTPAADASRDTAKDSLAAEALAHTADLPGLVTFAGYVGGLTSGREKVWCVLYLNTRLTRWLLVDTDGVVFRDRLKDDQAPRGQRDVIWVRADAPVALGNASEAAQAQFLTGEFTSAGDIDAPAGGGTTDAATGVFCEARSVGCCKNNTNSKYCGKP